jgi:hypothetical protein
VIESHWENSNVLLLGLLVGVSFQNKPTPRRETSGENVLQFTSEQLERDKILELQLSVVKAFQTESCPNSA